MATIKLLVMGFIGSCLLGYKYYEDHNARFVGIFPYALLFVVTVDFQFICTNFHETLEKK